MTSFFQKFSRKNKPVSKDFGTIPLGEEETISEKKEELPTLVLPVNHYEPPQLICGCGQSNGQQRDHNEDALFTLTTNLASDTRQIPFGFYIVADGMGGHQHGEVASAMAVRLMAAYVIRKLYIPLFNITPKPPDQSVQEVMQEGVLDAHRSILKQALGGGTTLTAALVLGDQLSIAHVGDSRAYTIDATGKVEVLTRDHSLVKRLEELGQITSEEAAVHPQRNVLYRAIGQGEPFDPDIITAPIPRAGYLLLCTDGLWGVVEQGKIVEIIANNPEPVLACQKLIEAANEGGGPDNISAVLVRMPS